MQTFLVCWALGLGFSVMQELLRPTYLIRLTQERNWGGVLQFFVITSVLYGLVFWGLFSLGSWLWGVVT